MHTAAPNAGTTAISAGYGGARGDGTYHPMGGSIDAPIVCRNSTTRLSVDVFTLRKTGIQIRRVQSKAQDVTDGRAEHFSRTMVRDDDAQLVNRHHKLEEPTTHASHART
ncbi:hypothetical protein MRS76_07990 [Rhizobiaceae bacterium n13]|uniref:Uncharacterized protein n=2 Tax=Ferirhizobium litorale TaxID=2927786 RepID=A0AAE3U1L2_9HYPH|nr:hypothetical protein [Fererhizobium litorale]MDI7861897.1 hypothetical protein [Fererhizobium litorale]MDI7921762.1 hypothetical protein [Fererhizobium litorale]